MHTLKIEQDDFDCNPRTEYDNVGTMACWHSRMLLGDEQPREEPGEFLRRLAGEHVGADDPDLIPDKHVQAILDKHFVILPVYAYEHGGITISTGPFSCPWDSGQVGFIYCTTADVQREWNGDKDKAIAYLKGEVNTYDQYLRGDVWGYVIEDSAGEVVDSRYGFFGRDLCKEEGQSALDHYNREERKALAARYLREVAAIGYPRVA
jgi:hypothetical protein